MRGRISKQELSLYLRSQTAATLVSVSKIIECKLCHQQGPCADAHIVARAFWKQVRGEAKNMHVLRAETGRVKSMRPVQGGPSDTQMLCQSCEHRLHSLDTYGIKFFRDLGFACEIIEAKDDGFSETIEVYSGVEIGTLRRFLIFQAWRFGVAHCQLFQDIDLGTQLEDLRVLVHNETIPSLEEFPVVLKRYESDHYALSPSGLYEVRPESSYNSPYILNDWGGRRVLRFQLASFVVFMAIDRLPLSGFWKSPSIGTSKMVACMQKAYSKSSDLKFLRETVVGARSPVCRSRTK